MWQRSVTGTLGTQGRCQYARTKSGHQPDLTFQQTQKLSTLFGYQIFLKHVLPRTLSKTHY